MVMSHLQKVKLKGVLYAVVALGLWVPTLHGFTSKTFYCPRSQGANAARDLVGWQTLINQPVCADVFGALALTFDYTRSFRPNELLNGLMGSKTVTVSGSSSYQRGSQDLLADYFGLPADFKSEVCFDPAIRNFIFDIACYFALDQLLEGLYVRFNAPVTQTGWDMTMQEFIKNPGTTTYPAGYLGRNQVAPSNPPYTFQDYMCGKVKVGDMNQSLEYGKICGSQVESRIAEFRGVVGWNGFGDRYHAGLNFRFAVPTGNRPDAQFLFDPLVGNGKHWEVGGGFTGHYDMWLYPERQQAFSCYLDANIMHLCATNQKRSFDFIRNGAGSRYMLLEEVAPVSTGLTLGFGGPASTYEYRSALIPAINATTLETKVSFAVQADIALKFAYQRRGLGVDVGYNFYARSGEKLHCREKFPSNQYAIKGDSQLYGFTSANVAVPLCPSQHAATLHAGQPSGNPTYTNANIDNPVNAADAGGLLNQLNATDSARLGIAQATVQTSDPVILLQDSDLNVQGALISRAITNALFFHVGHVWTDESTVIQPFLGFGGEVEWATGSQPSTYSEWSVWAKGGFGF